MATSLKVLSVQLGEIWKHFGLNQKVSIIMALLITLGAIGGLLYWSSRPDYQLLYSGLSLKDAAAVREKLADEKIPYEIKESGHTLLVQAGDVYRARLLLAGEGLPKDNSTGFELFETPKFGLTDFAQQVNYQRALQGELERTITAMSGIEAARVMLVLPKERLFASEEEKKASASIMLTLGGGAALSPAQIQSISQLVGSSVPGLTANSITITDQSGNLLTRPAGLDNSESAQATDQLAAQERVEILLTRKAQEMLDKSLGMGRSVVKVSAIMDFSQIEKRRENYDAEGRVVRAETIESESSSTPAGSSGQAAGVVANVPVGSPANGTIEQEMSKTKKENIRTEYAIPNDVELVTQKGARLANLSVAVCVAKGEQARGAEDIKKIEQMVRGCVGVVQNDLRKDTIEVTEMEFAPLPPPIVVPWWRSLPFRLDAVGRGLLSALLVYIIYRLSRRVIAGLVVRREDAGVPIQTLTDEYPGLEGGRRMGPRGEPVFDSALDEVTHIAEQNPKAIAAWIASVTKPTA